MVSVSPDRRGPFPIEDLVSIRPAASVPAGMKVQGHLVGRPHLNIRGEVLVKGSGESVYGVVCGGKEVYYLPFRVGPRVGATRAADPNPLPGEVG